MVWACPCQSCAYLRALMMKSVGSAGTQAVKLSVCSLIWQASFQGKITQQSKSRRGLIHQSEQIHQFSWHRFMFNSVTDALTMMAAKGKRLSKPLLSEVLVQLHPCSLLVSMSYLLFSHRLYSGPGTWKEQAGGSKCCPIANHLLLIH